MTFVLEESGVLGNVIQDPATDLHVPDLCDIELVSGLRRAIDRGGLAEHRAVEALTDYRELPITRHGHVSLLARILDLRDNFSAYDATYVALAERLDAPLLTADGRLGRAARTHTDIVVLP